MIVIGIDPGKSGGIVIIKDNENINQSSMIEMYKCPKSPIEMSSILRSARNTAWVENDKIVVAIEKVWAFPTDARSAAFKFGVNYCITMYKDMFLYDKNITYAVSDAALIALWCIERKTNAEDSS